MHYKYQAIDAQQQETSGSLTADTEREAARQLKQRNLTPINITVISNTKVRSNNKPKQRDILIVLHELTTLLESGVALIEAVESLANSSHHPFITQTFADISAELRHGKAFSSALQACPLELPWYVTQLVEAGELTGKIDIALRDGVNQMEYDAKVANEIRNAMIYPIILILSGISAVLMIFIIVVPRFANILKGKGDEIPMLAQIVLETGMFLNNNFDLVISGLVVLLVIITYVIGQPNLRAKIKDATAKLPLLGIWMIEAEAARWSAMLGTLLENKVSLLKALELAKQGVKLPSLNARLTQVNKAVKDGTSLSKALQDNDAMTTTGHNLIRAGERAGELPRMLRSLSKLLEESSRTRMKRFLLLIEPLAILLIGGVIGVIITGVILAITSVNKVTF